MKALIVAYAQNKVIGNKGKIPWTIKGEQKRFKDLTTGNVVIMGRRSYEEIGKPLPDRYTIVVSQTRKYEADNCITVDSFAKALEIAGDRDVYVSGGSGLYAEAIDIVDKMYVTEIEAPIEGDTYFPEFDKNKFTKEVNQHFEGEQPYTYVTYTRK
jgi:dihydrofolate reductase